MSATISFTTVGLITLAVFTLTIGQGSALQCWDCSSTNDRACNDVFNKTHVPLKDCGQSRSQSSHSSYSTAVCKKMKYTENGNLVTVRQCEWVNDYKSGNDEKSKTECAATVPPYRKVEYCNYCTENGCNGSNRDVIASIWCAVVPVIIYLCSKKIV